ncbi:ABC transporter permease [Fibrella sp. HMF5335]|uniref:ABC transporter permease n=1 Tax=Fibrella rubiginis TaxID=2817060 RepID=A0A939K5R1_9BACT|nr:ABC transporter permease [Fibrella rubiginis]MBO0937511.1 ABC transporter permease [Fibrella rubiginis]
MFRHYLTISLRNLQKNRIFTGINIVGLGLGIATFGLLWEYVAFERSVNQFHEKRVDIYRVLFQGPTGETSEYTPAGLVADAKPIFGEVQAACRIFTGGAQGIVSSTRPDGTVQAFREEAVAFVDDSFFSLFSFPLRSGSAAALRQPNAVFLSEAAARKYFGTQPALGKTLTVNGQFGTILYAVGGVYANMPANSDLQFDILFSLKTLAIPANLNGNTWADLTSYGNNFLTSYLLLSPTANIGALDKKLTQFYRQKKPDEAQTSVRLQPLTNQHLASSLGDAMVTTGSLSFVYLLGGLALLIVLIAWLNYVNLSTATALQRAKEVGLRKIVGATNSQLAGQLLGESLLLNALGLALGLLLLTLLQPVLNGFVEKDLSLSALLEGESGQGRFWVWGLLALLAGALLSGGYVAFAMTRTRAAEVVRAGVAKTGRSAWLRQGLVVVQFGIAVVLVVVTMVMYRQLHFLQNRPLGMRTAQLLTIEGPAVGKDQPDFKNRRAAFKQQVAALSYVETWCDAGNVPGRWYNFSGNGITRQVARPGDEQKSYNVLFVDDRYVPTFGIKMAAGQNFNPTMTETPYEKGGYVLLNEKAALAMGFNSAKEAVGQIVKWGANYEVAGVVSNYRHQSPKQSVDPIVFFPRANNGYVTVRLTPGQMPQKLAELERLYKASYPGNPFDYFFVDEKYNEQYRTEHQYGQLFGVAAGLAIFIACLGLFGLATFMAQQRTKEIGVRKVLGASVAGIATLLSKDFLKLVFVAFVLAAPLAWWAMNRWLQNFADKTPLDWWIFAGAGLLAVLIALFTVSFQSIRAALANPIRSLRSE